MIVNQPVVIDNVSFYMAVISDGMPGKPSKLSSTSVTIQVQLFLRTPKTNTLLV